MMSTMTYTPTDQLPSPPQWMLDEVAVAEQAHLDDLLDRCSTIRTFRKYVLPIYYRHKSATGHIMLTPSTTFTGRIWRRKSTTTETGGRISTLALLSK